MTQEEALTILKTGANVFLTGEPGSGKTHTVNHYVRWLHEHDIEPAITASTGIAATHIGGMTIHAWSGIGIKEALTKYDLRMIAANERVVKRMRRAKVLIIDEVSMLSANTLTMVDAACREVLSKTEPFGGLPVVLVGDFFQLPPIVKRREAEAGQASFADDNPPVFAYDSTAWGDANLTVCYLEEQHRQDDPEFLGVLSAIRQNIFNETHLAHIAKRMTSLATAPKNAPKLFTHNADVDRINAEMLKRLPGHENSFLMTSQGAPKLAATLIKNCLSPETLFLKINAAVMFTKNNQKEGYVNGTLGVVVGFSAHDGYPIVETRRRERIEVEPVEWMIEENDRPLARIKQIPLRLAWAITVHKSQGMSLDEAVMDLRNVFEFGQGYVALSRVRQLSGLHLLGWNERAFQVHPEILVKDEAFRGASVVAAHAQSATSAETAAAAHRDFILACGGNTASNETMKQKNMETNGARGGAKQPTIAMTHALLQSGKTIAEVAAIRNLTPGTVCAHITDLYKKGAVTQAELATFISTELKNALPEIHAAFHTIGHEKLTPVFQHFREKYSFDDLRFARILFKDD
ncbi:MAG: helix-turn-helix domain-containing protein [bacterium]|nr:helix-turn-helix domain-containing protein [bacterium]